MVIFIIHIIVVIGENHAQSLLLKDARQDTTVSSKARFCNGTSVFGIQFSFVITYTTEKQSPIIALIFYSLLLFVMVLL